MSDAGWSWRELWRAAAAVSDSPQEGRMVKLEMHNVDPKETFSSFDRTSFTFVRFGFFFFFLFSHDQWSERAEYIPTFFLCFTSVSIAILSVGGNFCSLSTLEQLFWSHAKSPFYFACFFQRLVADTGRTVYGQGNHSICSGLFSQFVFILCYSSPMPEVVFNGFSLIFCVVLGFLTAFWTCVSLTCVCVYNIIQKLNLIS